MIGKAVPDNRNGVLITTYCASKPGFHINLPNRLKWCRNDRDRPNSGITSNSIHDNVNKRREVSPRTLDPTSIPAVMRNTVNKGQNFSGLSRCCLSSAKMR